MTGFSQAHRSFTVDTGSPGLRVGRDWSEGYGSEFTMIEIRRIWTHAGENDAVHLLLTAGDDERHIKLKRAGNPAMYEFITAHAAVAADPQRDTDPATIDT